MNDIELRGRHRELAEVASLVRGAAAGRGGVLMLAGGVGAGKTALLTAAALTAVDMTVLMSRASQAESSLQFAGVHQLLGLMLEQAGSCLTGQIMTLLREVERRAGPADARLGARLLRVLREAAAVRPVLLCLDDVHRLDDQSWRTLVFVARRIPADPIAVLLAGLSEVGRNGESEGIKQIVLDDLDQADSRQLIVDLGCEADVAGALAPIACGNPRALTELAWSLTPEQRRGHAPLPHALPMESLMRRWLRQRLAQLSPSTRNVLLIASADELIEIDDLVSAIRAAGCDLADLESAELSGMIAMTGTAVSFHPALLRSVIYQEATLAQRRSAHAVLARVLDPTRQPLRHLWHKAVIAEGPDDGLAGDLSRAVEREAVAEPGRNWVPAARHAMASLAMERATQLCTRPTEAIGYLLESARQSWLGGQPYRAKMLLRTPHINKLPPDLQARYEMLLGEIELSAGDAGTARDALLAAARVLTARDPELALEALVRVVDAIFLVGQDEYLPAVASRALALRRSAEPPGVELLLELLSGFTAMFRGDFDDAIQPLRNVLAIAFQLDEPTALLRASTAAILLGDDDEAYRAAERAMILASTRGDTATMPHAMAAVALAEIAMGRYDSASANLLEAARLALACGQGTMAGNHLALLAVVAALLGDEPTCQLRIEQACKYAVGEESSRVKVLTEWAVAALDLACGRTSDASMRLRGIIGAGAGRGHSIVQFAATAHLVEAAVRSGDRESALEAFVSFGQWAGQAANPEWLALLARCGALLAEQEEQAEELYLQARRHHQLAGCGFQSARTDLLYGQWLRRRRRPGDARSVLLGAVEAFERFGSQLWADQAAAELRATGYQRESRQGATGSLGELSAQQDRIARMVADGSTNREIADALFLSTRTVEYHLRNIFARVGVRSRVELAKLLAGV